MELRANSWAIMGRNPQVIGPCFPPHGMEAAEKTKGSEMGQDSLLSITGLWENAAKQRVLTHLFVHLFVFTACRGTPSCDSKKQLPKTLVAQSCHQWHPK